jgi:hypothetical protein
MRLKIKQLEEMRIAHVEVVKNLKNVVELTIKI